MELRTELKLELLRCPQTEEPRSEKGLSVHLRCPLGHSGCSQERACGTNFERCKVHFMRNILAKVPHKEKGRFAAHLKQIWLQPDRKSARSAADLLCWDYEKRFPEAIRCLEDGLEDSLQFFGFPEIDSKKISSTNIPERTCREVRRRSRVIEVFPTVDSWVRLVTCYLVEYSEDWGIDRSYIRRDKIQEAMERNQAFLMAQPAN